MTLIDVRKASVTQHVEVELLLSLRDPRHVLRCEYYIFHVSFAVHSPHRSSSLLLSEQSVAENRRQRPHFRNNRSLQILRNISPKKSSSALSTMTSQRISHIMHLAFLVSLFHQVDAFVPLQSSSPRPLSLFLASHGGAATAAAADAQLTASFIDTELRGAAMRLHTREQAPKEGQAAAPARPAQPYVTTHADYLRFLVDSQHVYQALEDIVNARDDLAVFRKTGLERTVPLEQDIAFVMAEYKLSKPAVGKAGREYAELLRGIESVPEFVCHFYNFYFAHTAGGRMIGKFVILSAGMWC